MRYYAIKVFNGDGSVFQTANGQQAAWTSLTTLGTPDPAAANVAFDIPLYNQSNAQGACHLKIDGVGLPMISQATQFAAPTPSQKLLQISLGMSKGLPLANPNQVGVPITGLILQAYGNWQGNQQSLEFNFSWIPASPVAPDNLSFTWAKGTKLGDAIQTTLQAAFPGYSVIIAVNSNIVAPEDQHGVYRTPDDFIQAMYRLSIATLNKPNYPGVKMYVRGKTISVYDDNSTDAGGLAEQSGGTSVGNTSTSATGTGNSESDPKQILFTDLIGQPVWQSVNQIQFYCVMRGDLAPNKYIKMPAASTVSNAGSNGQYRNNLTFQGTFVVTRVRLVGNFRQPSAEAWVTVVDAVSLVPQ